MELLFFSVSSFVYILLKKKKKKKSMCMLSLIATRRLKIDRMTIEA